MTAKVQPSDSNWVRRHTIAFGGVVVMVIIVVVVAFQPNITFGPLRIWFVLLALFTAATLIISRAFTQRWLGILIDERNKYSLSRLQMVMWTIIVLSAFMAAVLANIQLKLLISVSGAVDPTQVFTMPAGNLVGDALLYAGVLEEDQASGSLKAITGVDISQINLAEPLQDGQRIYVPKAGEKPPTELAPLEGQPATPPNTPLSIQIPNEIWVLLGISTTSLVAAPLIKGQKAQTVVRNDAASEARLADLFQGEENNNATLMDLGKVQLMYFTLIVVGAYMIALANLFIAAWSQGRAITSLPALEGGVVAMLGVSHVGYLTGKATNRSGSDSDGGGDKSNGQPPASDTPPTLPTPPAPAAPLAPGDPNTASTG